MSRRPLRFPHRFRRPPCRHRARHGPARWPSRRRSNRRRVMRIGASRQEDFEINVISLIDVMLTLLMFFVMTTTFVQHSRMKVALPEASETVQEAELKPLVVMIDSNSKFYVDNNEVLNPSVDTVKE